LFIFIRVIEYIVLCIAVVITNGDGDCDSGWQSNFGYEYCLEDNEKSHSNARSTCQMKNSELASITSDAECDYLAGLMLVNFL